MVGLLGQVVVLGVLDATVGLAALAWAAGLAYGLVTCAALTRGLNHPGVPVFGPADAVTLTRATLVGGVVALAFSPDPHTAMLATLTAVALALDAVDGQVARRTGTVSELGARFDMEVDAFLILILSWYVGRSAGWWVLSIGMMRYAYAAAGWALPWLRGRLPARFWRKVAAAAQGIVLLVAAAVPGPWTTATLVVALVLLLESFGHDVAWLWRRRRATLT